MSIERNTGIPDMTRYRAKIIAVSPSGYAITFEGKQPALYSLPETPEHWSIHDELNGNALLGMIPKTWAIKWEYQAVPLEELRAA